MTDRTEITDSCGLAIFTLMAHIKETLHQEVRPAGIKVELTNYGNLPIFVQMSGKVEVVKTQKKYGFMSIIHLNKNSAGNWITSFVNAQIT
ncbi:hypothetical protein KAI92_02870 [Candidatus Parcubacteria bacterium]|nr:hypothetical protein [Candidatus Parcubacteria bacterium]